MIRLANDAWGVRSLRCAWPVHSASEKGGPAVRRFISLASVVATIAALMVLDAGPATARPRPNEETFERRFESFGLGPATQAIQPANRLTECPQAGLTDRDPSPLDLRKIDVVEQISNSDEIDDIRVNQDYSCLPQNETSVEVNPKRPRNVLAGQNDYRMGWATSGFGASSNFGRSWYDGITGFPTPVPLVPTVQLSDDHIDGGGDPVAVYDRAGVAYYAQIHFERERDDNGIFVNRSTNGGFTWSRPCVPIFRTNLPSVCGGPGDVRQPGDGVVVFEEDPNGTGDPPAAAFHDKEWMDAGPRPAGVGPKCFTQANPVDESRTEVPCESEVVGVDRLYVTWTRFSNVNPFQSEIYFSFSDDQARSWSPPTKIPNTALVCTLPVPSQCIGNQYSNPTVHPKTGFVYVAFENFNTPAENQFLLVRTKDGGTTWEGPFLISPVFDINYPDAGGDRPDCTDRGQQEGRPVLTNSCFRVNSGGNVVVDKRGTLTSGIHNPGNKTFADDLYAVVSDNRNGTREDTNTDVFLFKSTDGGQTWLGPTRVNNDKSKRAADPDCSPGDEGCAGPFGNDQWFPWIDIGSQGALNVVFHDRRLDTTSTREEWPTSRSRPGNYLAWFWGAQCLVTTTGPISTAAGQQCTAKSAEIIQTPDVGGDLPGPGPLPTLAASKSPFRNFQVSDVPFNLDYSFRAGLFMGDYNNVSVFGNTAYAFWTDARNGRSSQNVPGKNPFCEQSDVFIDGYSATNANTNPLGTVNQRPFERTRCPLLAVDRRGDDNDDDDDDDDD